MTNPAPNEGKLHALIEKFGGWAALMLLSLIIYQYQTDKAYMQESIAAANARIGASERAIGRVQDTKASREEVKALNEQWLRDMQGLKSDFKDGISLLRNDLAARLDLSSKRGN